MDASLLKERALKINEIIYRYLPAEDGFNGKIISAVRYSVEAGGKRLRPLLMQEAFRMFREGENEPETLHVFMAALEFIHTYSLVHDDLPAMDDDMYRRGNLTTHAKYGEAFGVLAGDALLHHAFEIIANIIDSLKSTKEIISCVSALKILAHKAGIYGMVGGQCLDVESEKDSGFINTKERLEYIYRNKTAALIEAALMIGSSLAGAQESEVSLMEEAGYSLGMAFQIQDDILDVTSTTEVLGKPVGSDEKNNKETYVTYIGLSKAHEKVKSYTKDALLALEKTKKESPFLRELFIYLIDRKK